MQRDHCQSFLVTIQGALKPGEDIFTPPENELQMDVQILNRTRPIFVRHVFLAVRGT